MCKISVIIPVYNAENYLSDCLESIINQTLKDIEIICVDDGSIDKSLDILKDYAEKDTRVKVFQQENKGAGGARNLGIQHAAGKYFSFLDADDFFELDMLEKSYSAAEKNQSQIVVFGCDLFINSKKCFEPCNYSINYSILPDNNSSFASTDIRKDIFKVFVGWAWDKLFLAEFIRTNNIIFQEQRTSNDLLFVFSALVKAERVTVISDILAHYRREEGSLSVTRENSWYCFYDALTSLRSKLTDWNLYERFQQDYINYCVNFSLWNLNTLSEPTKTILYNKLRNEWFENLGVTNFKEEYFYNKKEYYQYIWILQNPVTKNPDIKFRLKMKYLDTSEKISKAFNLVKINGISYTISFILKKLK